MGKLIWWYQALHFVLFFWLFQLTCSSSNFSSFSPKLPKTCLPKESFALLQFKSTFSIDHYSYGWCDFHPRTESWEEGTDCCLWDGVTCDGLTGHVVSLDLSCSGLYGTIPSNSTLFLLSHLQRLNLAFNYFDYSPIPSQFALFAKLTHLNLSNSEFSGQIPPELSHLSKMVSLDLSPNHLEFETHSFEKLSQNLTQLRVLHLSGVNMSSIAPKSLLNLSSALRSLRLDDCSMQGKLPEDIFQFPSLEVLDLSSNGDVTGNLPKSNWSSPLRILDLLFMNLSGEIPNSIGNLKSMEQLHLSSNTFSGQLPFSVFNLTQLFILDFSFNQLVGRLPCSAFSLPNLDFLELSNNLLEDRIPSWLFTLPSLQALDLTNNILTGPIDPFQQNNSLLLNVFLTNNKIHGPIPSSIFELENLILLDISFNNLSGIIEWNMLQKLKNLVKLDLSHNVGLSSAMSNIVNFSMPNIHWLDLSSCNISEFPNFLRNLENLGFLNLSNNRIHGWISKEEPKGWSSLYFLDLSENFLTGLEQHPWDNIEALDLSSNLLQGPLPVPPASTRGFIISNNKLRGAIPSLLCDIYDLSILDLSDNGLSGVLPQCFGNFSRSLSILNLRNNNLRGNIIGTLPTGLTFLDLSGNQFNGPLPRSLVNCSMLEFLNVGSNKINGTFPYWLKTLPKLKILVLGSNNFHGSIIGMLPSGLTYLDLSGNQFNGPLPRSLVNCSELEFLNVGSNKINGTFPYWLETLPKLKILVLQSNNFRGTIGHPKIATPFPQLQILDLSHNEFIGHLPIKYLQNLKFPTKMEGAYVGEFSNVPPISRSFSIDMEKWRAQLVVTMKGLEIEVDHIHNSYTNIDFSNNQFQGEIPESIGMLKSVLVLNLSHNNFVGHIPSSLGNMTALESLDLSSNKLVGEIPRQLTDLTFLEVLNLSNNQLTGPIPQAKQFGTFPNDSYIGNLGLCGLPLSKKCSNNEPPQPPLARSNEEENDSTDWFWKIAAMGYGCGVVIGLSLGYIVFATRKPQWFVRLVERKHNKKVRRSNPRSRGRRN